MNKLDVETRIALSKTYQIMELFRAMDHTLPLSEVMTFLVIALNDDVTVRELHEKLGYSEGTASRHTQHLAKLDRNRDPGLELITDETDIMDRRKNIRAVTPKGQKILKQIAALWGHQLNYKGVR